MSSRVEEKNGRKIDQVVASIGKLSDREQEAVFSQLTRRFADDAREVAIRDAAGQVVGYFVPAEIRATLTSPELRKQLRQRQANPGKTSTLRQVNARLKSRARVA